MFKIQSGVTLPPKTRGTGSSKYPLAQLEVGQSFFIPAATKATGVTLSKLAKSLNIAITTRKANDFADYDENGDGVGEKVDGLRVWRIEGQAKA